MNSLTAAVRGLVILAILMGAIMLVYGGGEKE